MVEYWWASQNANYPKVIELGTLWTCPRENGSVDSSRGMIKSLKPGDIVFHHYKSYLRAVSRVTESWVPWVRPEGYPKVYMKEGDDGWLVTVDPIRTDFMLHYERVAELIRIGAEAPLNILGRPQQKYLSALSEEDGLALLTELDLPASGPNTQGLFGRPDEYWGGGETNEMSLGEVRREQSDLRRHLLQGRTVAPCSLCGEARPSRLLIAGHIKPRSKCTEGERKDFRSVAMLVCSLGCDALFGWGYIIVDPTGRVCPGIRAETKEVQAAVDLLVGKSCTVHNEHTAPNFAAHADLTAVHS
ncbi:HNH endonuclease signature motif containing protein [Arthrobacter sp. CAN_C5]|uniref:HNH endonuclease signature motif containing protein n=1 Tax=Arthrobacter sp. CAN_C5 TaxID=2760706 RepID=UPI001AE5A8AA|nr:HNH endonuclease signature motif containing protein [Arthrobacter sp. CAN_C5]MBP2218016.1 hypothetical protein [Arthrobacter sp. CAN_C5]